MSRLSIRDLWNNTKRQVGIIFGCSAAVSGILFLISIAAVPFSGLAGVLMWIPAVVAGIVLIPMLVIAPLWWVKNISMFIWKPDEFTGGDDMLPFVATLVSGIAGLMFLIAGSATSEKTMATVGFWIGLPTFLNVIAWLSHRGYSAGRNLVQEWNSALRSRS